MPRTPPIEVPIVGDDKVSKVLGKVEGRVKKISSRINKVGNVMMKSIALPVAAIGVASLKASRDMNKAMANVSTLLDGTDKQVLERTQTLKSSVQDIAKETGITTSNITDGLYETISAFGDTEETVGRLNATVKAGKAGGASTLETLKLLSAVTKGYGDTSTEAVKKASDLAFLTVKMGQTTFPELAASMGKVVPMAATLKTSQEELFGTMATLTGVTGDASEVSTQLSSIYGAVLKPTAAMTKAAKKFGYESSIAMFRELGLAQSLIKLEEAAGGSEKNLAKMLSRKEGLNAALALLGPQSETYVKKLKDIQKWSGKTNEAYKRQTEGINKAGHQYDQLIQRLTVTAQKIGDRLTPTIMKLLDRLDPWLDKLDKLEDHHIDQAIAIGKLLIKLTLFTKAVGFLGGAFSGTIAKMIVGRKAMASFGTATEAATKSGGRFTGVLGKIGAGLAALGVGIEIGKAINEIFIDPNIAKASKERRDAYSSEIKANTILKNKVPETYDAINKSIKETEEMMKKVSKSQVEVAGSFSFEDIPSELMSGFGLWGETNREKARKQAEKLGKKYEELSERRSGLAAKRLELVKGGDIEAIEGAQRLFAPEKKEIIEKKTEEKVTIDWGTPPPGVTVRRQGIPEPDTGLAMEGI